jgi:hypothetical protein
VHCADDNVVNVDRINLDVIARSFHDGSKKVGALDVLVSSCEGSTHGRAESHGDDNCGHSIKGGSTLA